MEQQEPAAEVPPAVELEDGTVLERHGDELRTVSSTGAESQWPVPDKWVQTVEKVGQVDKLSKSKTPVIRSVRWQTRELRVDGQDFSYSDPSGSTKGQCKFTAGTTCRLVNAGDRIRADAFEVPNTKRAPKFQNNTIGAQSTTGVLSQPSTHLVGAHNVFTIYLPEQEVGAVDAVLGAMPVAGLDGGNIAQTAGKANAASKQNRARTYYFGAESPAAAKEWVDAINANLQAQAASGDINDSALHELARNLALVGVDVNGVDLVAAMNQLMAPSSLCLPDADAARTSDHVWAAEGAHRGTSTLPHRQTHTEMATLPLVVDMSEERKAAWYRLWDQVGGCGRKSGVESAAHEERVRAGLERVRAEDPDVLVAVAVGGWGWASLMHLTARTARTEGLVRDVWECCGERALLLMRYRDFDGQTALYCLARNPNMTRGMYAVFAQHCTQDDLRAANNNGWTMLFRMALTFIHDAKTQEQKENVASVMCTAVQCLGPGALLAESTMADMILEKMYPAGSTPRSILHDAGDKSRALLQRLDEAATQSKTSGTDDEADTITATARLAAQPAAAP